MVAGVLVSWSKSQWGPNPAFNADPRPAGLRAGPGGPVNLYRLGGTNDDPMGHIAAGDPLGNAPRPPLKRNFGIYSVAQLLLVALWVSGILLPLSTRGVGCTSTRVSSFSSLRGLGVVRCRAAYANAPDDRLLENFVVLSVPLTIKVTPVHLDSGHTAVYWAMARYAEKN